MEKIVLKQKHRFYYVLFRPRLQIKRAHICKVGFLEKAILKKVWGKAAMRKVIVMRVRVCSAKATEASIGYEKRSKPMAN